MDDTIPLPAKYRKLKFFETPFVVSGTCFLSVLWIFIAIHHFDLLTPLDRAYALSIPVLVGRVLLIVFPFGAVWPFVHYAGDADLLGTVTVIGVFVSFVDGIFQFPYSIQYPWIVAFYLSMVVFFIALTGPFLYVLVFWRPACEVVARSRLFCDAYTLMDLLVPCAHTAYETSCVVRPEKLCSFHLGRGRSVRVTPFLQKRVWLF